MKGFMVITVQMNLSGLESRCDLGHVRAHLDVCNWRADIWVNDQLVKSSFAWEPRLGRFQKYIELTDDALDYKESVALQEELESALRRALKAAQKTAQEATDSDATQGRSLRCGVSFGDKRNGALRLVGLDAE